MPCKNIYALYRGEEYIMDGTIPELAEKTGYKRTTLYWLATPTEGGKYMAAYTTLEGTMFQPELRTTKNGKTVMEFNLSYYQGKGQDGKATYGNIRIRLWNDLAANAMAELKDRDRVLVYGRQVQDKWEKDGQKRSRDVIIADSIGRSISPFPPNSIQPAGRADDPDVPF